MEQNNKRMYTAAGEEKNSEKQIFCLLDSVFSENKKDDSLKDEKNYEERDIFGYKSSYLNYLRKEFASLTRNEKKTNMTSKFTHNYDNKIYGKIIMELNSVKIEITNKILARTKGLTLSSKKYHNYLENFSEESPEKLYEQKTEYNLPCINSKKLKNYKTFYKPRKTITPKMTKKYIDRI